MTIGRNSKPNASRCPHENTVNVTTLGIERTICEACGNVSVLFSDGLEGEVDREQFARQADRIHDRASAAR